MIVNQLYIEVIERLKGAPFIESAPLEARLLLCHVLNMSSSDFILKRESLELSDENIESVKGLVEARLDGKSIASLVGKKEFYDIEVYVNDDVLIPRPETELLVEQVLERLEIGRSYRALDIGTGSGIIPLTLVKHFATISFDAIDKSAAALAVARKNRELNRLNTEKVNFIEADLFSYKPAGGYDLIISNPPYIPEAEVKELIKDRLVADPVMALAGGETGLDFYYEIREFAEHHLNAGGFIFLEHGHSQRADIENIFHNRGYDIFCYRDLAGLDRVIVLHKKSSESL